nr:MAG TPA: Microcompartments protein [Caudoviricetes sp.]
MLSHGYRMLHGCLSIGTRNRSWSHTLAVKS